LEGILAKDSEGKKFWEGLLILNRLKDERQAQRNLVRKKRNKAHRKIDKKRGGTYGKT